MTDTIGSQDFGHIYCKRELSFQQAICCLSFRCMSEHIHVVNSVIKMVKNPKHITTSSKPNIHQSTPQQVVWHLWCRWVKFFLHSWLLACDANGWMSGLEEDVFALFTELQSMHLICSLTWKSDSMACWNMRISFTYMCSEVSLTQKLLELRNLAVEHNIATFSELSLTAAHWWQGRLTRGWYCE